MSAPEPQEPDRTTADYIVEAFAEMREHSDKAARWCWRAALSLSVGSFVELAAQSAPWPWYPLVWAVALGFCLDAAVGITAVIIIAVSVFLGRKTP